MYSDTKKHGPWLTVYRIVLSLIAAWILYKPPPPPTAIEIIKDSLARQTMAEFQRIELVTQVSEQSVPEYFRYEKVATDKADIDYMRRWTDGKFTCIKIGHQTNPQIFVKDEAGWRENSKIKQCIVLDGILTMTFLQYNASTDPLPSVMSGYVVSAGNERLENGSFVDIYQAKSWPRQGERSVKQLDSKIWIATDTMLPYKIEMVDETAERRSTHTLRFSYPTELNIENPCVEGC